MEAGSVPVVKYCAEIPFTRMRHNKIKLTRIFTDSRLCETSQQKYHIFPYRKQKPHRMLGTASYLYPHPPTEAGVGKMGTHTALPRLGEGKGGGFYLLITIFLRMCLLLFLRIIE